MNTIQTLIFVLRYSLKFLSALFLPRAHVAAQLIAAESQLSVIKHRIDQKKEPRPRFTPAFRFLWALLAKYWSDWRKAAHLMQPETVIKWHRQGFRLFMALEVPKERKTGNRSWDPKTYTAIEPGECSLDS